MTVTASPSVADFQAFDECNAPMAGHARLVPRAMLIHGEAKVAIGGLWGSAVCSWLIIGVLFVPEAPRRRRFRATEARMPGRIAMRVETFEFQAQPFYESLGFTMFGVPRNFTLGHRRVSLREPFDDG